MRDLEKWGGKPGFGLKNPNYCEMYSRKGVKPWANVMVKTTEKR